MLIGHEFSGIGQESIFISQTKWRLFEQLNVRRLRMSERCIATRLSILWIARMALKIRKSILSILQTKNAYDIMPVGKMIRLNSFITQQKPQSCDL